jgi:hypothetical protein
MRLPRRASLPTPRFTQQAAAAKCQVGESKSLEGSTLRRELLVTGPKLGPALEVPERARTLPPKSPQSSSEWPPAVSSPLLSCQRPTYRPHQKSTEGCQTKGFLPPSKPFSLPPSSFIKLFFPLVARGHLSPPQRRHFAPNPTPNSAGFRSARSSNRQDGSRAHSRPP